MSAPEPPPDPQTPPPRRLDPRTILIRALQGFPSAIFAIPVALAWMRGDGLPLGVLLPVIALFMAVALGVGWLHWRVFTYQILPGQVVISRGLVKRTRRSIPAERIQDVSITQSLLSRLFGLAEVRIETGGGEADEGRLNSVSLTEAHRLRDVLRGIRTGDPLVSDVMHSDRVVDVEPVLFRMGLGRLICSGLFNFSLIWVAAIFGGLQYVGQTLGYGWDQWRDMAGLAERELQSRLTLQVALGLGGIVIGLGLLAGVARTVLKNYGFTLTHAETRFRLRRGLLSRTDVVLAKRQIQLGRIQRGAVSGRLGWRALQVQTLGGGDQAAGRQELAPFARPAELEPILALAGLPPFERSRLEAVSPWHIVGGLIGFVVLPTILVLLSTLAFPPAAWLLLVMPVPIAVALMRRRCHRYALAPTSVQVMRGVLDQIDWTVPYGNVQAVSVQRGPVQRWLGIATVWIDTAGGIGPQVHDIDEAVASAFVGDLIARVEARDAGPRLG